MFHTGRHCLNVPDNESTVQGVGKSHSMAGNPRLNVPAFVKWANHWRSGIPDAQLKKTAGVHVNTI